MDRWPLTAALSDLTSPLAGGDRRYRPRIAVPLAAAGLAWAALMLAPLAWAGGIMARSEVHLSMPDDTDARPLEGLFFGSHQQEMVAEITSIRLKSLPEEGDDPVRLLWVVMMSNSRVITQVVNLKITLRDEDGKRLATARGRLSIATRTDDKEYEIKMKVKPEAWEASSELELQADWIG